MIPVQDVDAVTLSNASKTGKIEQKSLEEPGHRGQYPETWARALTSQRQAVDLKRETAIR